MVRTAAVLLILLIGALRPGAQHAASPAAFASAASEARKFQLAPGLKLDVWAAEPQLSNSVAFGFDGKGRVFLAESDRWAISVFDITAHTNWLLEDMAFRTVADRAAFLTREFATNLSLLTRDSETVRVLEDRNGDGRADHSQVVATGFHSVVDGTAAGILADRDHLYFANIPTLWRLQPLPSGPPSPTENWQLKPENLATGFGVHIGVSGHDFHGLIKGHDGRIYMSFGDRGVCLTNREGVLINLPDTGGVLRCEPDGRNLEVFCYGLRNPQELAFDDLGNLWTVDNDTAGADPCRVLHLVEGGDYGWRTSYQHMEGFGPWVQEELWKGGQDGILPPAGTVSQGPSGLALYPGTGFGERLKGTFLHADFPGGVWAFTVKPQGASYVVDRKEKFLWNCWPTDVDFGPDGGAYILDWVSGWGQTPRGRIYRLTPNPALAPGEVQLAAETQRLLGEGMLSRGEKELLGLLGHADRRVRLEAQWALAGRGTNSLTGLIAKSLEQRDLIATLHALWATEQIIRDNQAVYLRDHARGAELAKQLCRLFPLVESDDPEIRGQAALSLCTINLGNVRDFLPILLVDPDARVRFLAGQAILRALKSSTGFVNPGIQRRTAEGLRRRASALITSGSKLDLYLQSVGQRGYELHEEALLRIAAAAASPWVEHVAMSVLCWLPSTPLQSAAEDGDSDVRRIAVGTMRRLTNAAITQFLSDPDPALVTAAGRAIHDVPIVEGFPALASFITKVDCPTYLHSRVIDACFRLGTQQHAQMLAGFAAREDVPDAARVLAIRALGDWERPPPLDRVNGLWRPLVTIAAEKQTDPSLVTSSATGSGNPLLERAAQAQAGRNLGRASEVPLLPADLGRSVSYADAMALRRNPAPAQRAFLRVAGDLLNPHNLNEAGVPAGSREVLPLQIAVVETSARLRVKEAGTPLFEKFGAPGTPLELRRAILPALAALGSPLTGDAVALALADGDPLLRAAGVPFVDRLDGDGAVGLLAALIPGKPGELALAQAALAALGRRAAADPRAAAVLRALESTQGSRPLPAGLRLELREALREAGLGTAPGGDADRYTDCLEGGDAGRGQRVFRENPTVQCLRCHRVGADGGSVGPDLSKAGGRLSRAELLESLVTPNARLAAGFEAVVLSLTDGTEIIGTVRGETPDALTLDVLDPDTGEGTSRTVAKGLVRSRDRGPSAMPEGLAEALTVFEVRDLVEYLASLR
ncbi:MAG: PQQ-dependent sugar dehydrogenase [Verrucomicrobia bacterium]|nr:PQQ-dependent sugar dehydrogenase [Verrucomicrobiota bacterium]